MEKWAIFTMKDDMDEAVFIIVTYKPSEIGIYIINIKRLTH